MRGSRFAVVLAVVLLLAPAARATEPLVVGEHVAERFETPHPYASSGGTSPALTWSDRIDFPGATYIAPHFSRFELAPGDFVVVRSPDFSRSWTYEGFGKGDLGRRGNAGFWTHIKGDAAVIDLYTVGSSEGWGYAVDKYGRGYNDDEIRWFWSQGLGEEMNLVRPIEDPESIQPDDVGML